MGNKDTLKIRDNIATVKLMDTEKLRKKIYCFKQKLT